MRAVAAPAVGFSVPALSRSSGAIVVVDDGAGIAVRVVEGLERLGARARVARETSECSGCSSVVYLGGLVAPESAEAAMAVNRDAFLWARAAGPTLAAEEGLFVTVQDTGGDFGLGGGTGDRAWAAGLPALAKTAQLEWPDCTVKAIDIECSGLASEEIASRIIRELTAGGPEIEVGLRSDGQRLTVAEIEEPSDGQRPIGMKGLSTGSAAPVWVVSGGARGVTAACLRAIAAEKKLRLVLLGRTRLVPESPKTQGVESEAELTRVLLSDPGSEMPSPIEARREARSILARREVGETIHSLQSLGARVKYLEVSVEDNAALADCLAKVREEWGPITGIIHAAGIIADKRITEKSPEQFERVFATKVHGLRALLQATERDPLQLICLFSSVAARFGNIGQSDYAMANEVMNRVASREAVRRESCLVKSINWGAWNGGMVSPELRRHFDRLGVPLIPLEVGARHFTNELSLPGTEVVVVPSDAANHLGGSATNRRVMEIRCDLSHFPYLVDHSIGGAPVVPLVLVIDWFLRAARALHYGMKVGSIDDLRVVRGIRLERFAEEAYRFRIELSESGGRSSPDQAPQVEATLRSENGELYYRASIRMMRATVSAAGISDDEIELSRPGAVAQIRTELAAGESPTGSPAMSGAGYNPYDGHLFHGPAFETIAGIDRMTESAVVARLKRRDEVTAAAGPNAEGMEAAMLLDAGLQAAQLWGIHMVGRKTLPMYVARFLQSDHAETPARCVVLGQKANDLRTVTDVYLLSDTQTVISALFGVEMYATREEVRS